jgi:pyruvate,water dikinase
MRFLVQQARKHVKNREIMRFARTKTFGLLRAMLNRIGRELHARGLLDAPHDVYLLEIDEVTGFVDGSATCTNLRGLTRLRGEENARYRAMPEPDDRFTTTGAVHIGNAFRSSAGSASEGALHGTPCSPGRVRGPVRVIRSPKDDLTLRGEILVAARTDPGWVPLYPSASGLLIERGSVLSHSAIVARELGLPTIVNVPHLMERLRDGIIVEMDATTGVITIVDAPADLARAAE